MPPYRHKTSKLHRQFDGAACYTRHYIELFGRMSRGEYELGSIRSRSAGCTQRNGGMRVESVCRSLPHKVHGIRYLHIAHRRRGSNVGTHSACIASVYVQKPGPTRRISHINGRSISAHRLCHAIDGFSGEQTPEGAVGICGPDKRACLKPHAASHSSGSQYAEVA